MRVAIADVNDLVPYFMCAPYHKAISEVKTQAVNMLLKFHDIWHFKNFIDIYML